SVAFNSSAQCPTSASISNIITATCPSNGSFTVIVDSPGSNVTYQIVSGPVGYPIGAQSESIFASLLPGTYEVNILCNNSVVTSVSGIVIPNAYTPLNLNSTATNVCSSSQMYGTIDAVATGGSAPLQYTYVF